jgi:hypothetical protein
MTKLDEIEARLQSLLDTLLLKYPPGYMGGNGIVQQFAVALFSNLHQQEEVTLAPNGYAIVAHPSTLTRWRTDTNLLVGLAKVLFTVGDEAGFVFLAKPSVTTSADVSMAIGEIRVLASFNSSSLADTHGFPGETRIAPKPELVPENAFLILNGTQIIPLTQLIVNIGRRLDNQVVIDDPRVSRKHAQMRVVKGRYIIFDLDSSGGLYINGQRTKQSVLYPGDVISLAGINLVFGQDIPASRSPENNPDQAPTFSGDRPTAILKRDDLY